MHHLCVAPDEAPSFLWCRSFQKGLRRRRDRKDGSCAEESREPCEVERSETADPAQENGTSTTTETNTQATQAGPIGRFEKPKPKVPLSGSLPEAPGPSESQLTACSFGLHLRRCAISTSSTSSRRIPVTESIPVTGVLMPV